MRLDLTRITNFLDLGTGGETRDIFAHCNISTKIEKLIRALVTDFIMPRHRQGSSYYYFYLDFDSSFVSRLQCRHLQRGRQLPHAANAELSESKRQYRATKKVRWKRHHFLHTLSTYVCLSSVCGHTHTQSKEKSMSTEKDKEQKKRVCVLRESEERRSPEAEIISASAREKSERERETRHPSHVSRRSTLK